MRTLRLLSLFFSVLIVVNLKAQCVASGSVTLTGNPGEIYIVDSSTNTTAGAAATVSWLSILDTNYNSIADIYLQPDSSTAHYTFAQNGYYLYFLQVSDTLSLCYDSIGGAVTISNITPPPSCSASFTLNSDSASIGQYYAWNLSTGNNLTYSWSFGDGGSSSLAFPTHVYTSVGTYQVCLTIDDGNGCTDTFCDSISVLVKSNGTTLNVLAPGQTLSIAENEFLNGFDVYPNPTKGQFVLDLNIKDRSNLSIKIADIYGKELFEEQIKFSSGRNLKQIDFSNYPTGVYIIQIQEKSSGRIANKRIIIN